MYSIKNIALIIIIGVTSFLTALSAQDPVFSQYYSNPLELNPALAGVSGGTRLGINYRNQWANLSSNYVTYSIYGDQFFKKYNSGLGLSLLLDNSAQGILRTINADLSYAYEIETRRDISFRLGFQVGIISASLDWDRLIFYDAIDPEFGPISPGGIPYPTKEISPDQTNVTRIDAGVGGLVLSDRFFIGLSLKHLARPDITFYNPVNTKRGLPIRTVVHGGVQIPLKESGRYGRKPVLSIMPTLLAAAQANTGQITPGAILQMKTINFGLHYRHAFKNPDAIIGSIGFEFENIRAGYSYDATISGLGFSSGGTHEVFLSVAFNQDPDSKYDCRKIFR